MADRAWPGLRLTIRGRQLLHHLHSDQDGLLEQLLHAGSDERNRQPESEEADRERDREADREDVQLRCGARHDPDRDVGDQQRAR